MKTKEMRSLIETYKAVFKSLDDNKRQAFIWLRAIVTLFLLPVLYPLLWVVLKLKETVSEN